jgi:hypothetical protein
MEAEMMEALSEINSLAGVSGRMDAATDRTAGVARMGVDGASVLGVETTLSVFGAALARGDEAETGVGSGSAGKAESRSAVALSTADCASRFLTWAALVAAAMFRIPGTGRFSAFLSAAFSRTLSGPFSRAFVSSFGSLGISVFSGAGVGVAAGADFSLSFPLSFAFSFALSVDLSGDFLLLVALLAAALGGMTGVAAGGLGELRAGKSSSRSFDLALEMSFDRPLSAARALTAFLASGIGVMAFFVSGLDAVTGGFTKALDSATGGVWRPTLAVGREECDMAGDGWALGKENPGGTDGVPERASNSNAPGGWRMFASMGSSATSASMLEVTSSSEGSSSST